MKCYGEQGEKMLGQLTVETLLITGIGALTTSVAALFGLFVNGYKRIQKKLDECEKDRQELWRAVKRSRA